MYDQQIIHCPDCGEPYYFANMMVGDQTRCPDCRRKVRDRIRENDERREKRHEEARDKIAKDIEDHPLNFDVGGRRWKSTRHSLLGQKNKQDDHQLCCS